MQMQKVLAKISDYDKEALAKMAKNLMAHESPTHQSRIASQMDCVTFMYTADPKVIESVREHFIEQGWRPQIQ